MVRTNIFGSAASNMVSVSIFVEKLGNRAFLNFGGGGGVVVVVVVTEVVGCRDHHFPFPHTEFSLSTNFRWKPSIFLVPLPWKIGHFLFFIFFNALLSRDNGIPGRVTEI